MSYFENSARVPLLLHYPKLFHPRRVSQNVSTLDILPTMCDLIGTKPDSFLPMHGVSLLPHLQGRPGHDEVFSEYTGEGTVRPLMMIRRGPWKYITCPADGHQLYNLKNDPLELHDLTKSLKKKTTLSAEDQKVQALLDDFEAEAKAKWDFDAITKAVLLSQRKRQLVWKALKRGRFEQWDYNPLDDGRQK